MQHDVHFMVLWFYDQRLKAACFNYVIHVKAQLETRAEDKQQL